MSDNALSAFFSAAMALLTAAFGAWAAFEASGRPAPSAVIGVGLVAALASMLLGAILVRSPTPRSSNMISKPIEDPRLAEQNTPIITRVDIPRSPSRGTSTSRRGFIQKIGAFIIGSVYGLFVGSLAGMMLGAVWGLANEPGLIQSAKTGGLIGAALGVLGFGVVAWDESVASMTGFDNESAGWKAETIAGSIVLGAILVGVVAGIAGVALAKAGDTPFWIMIGVTIGSCMGLWRAWAMMK